MWLNPQSWSVISGLANEAQADLALQNVYDKLNTEYGAILMDPPYHAHAFDGALAVIYNAGTKENAGIFSQSQGWIILAEALRGHGERAFNYFIENAPAAQNDRAEIRRLEPYCYGQFTEGKAQSELRTFTCTLAHRNSIYGYGGMCRRNSRNAARLLWTEDCSVSTERVGGI